MTLIFGARCTDGVVLVSDRLVRSGEFVGHNAEKVRKCENIPWAIFGAAGLENLFEEFLTILPQNVNRRLSWITYQNAKLKKDREDTFGNNPDAPNPPYFEYSVVDFKQDCVELLTDMKKRYSVAFENDDECALQILIAVNARDDLAKLYYLESTNCLPVEVPEAVFIGYNPIVEIFRKCWNKSMNMVQSAKIGAFAIKYVETDEITKNVGVGKGLPQIWCIPDGGQTKEIIGVPLSTIMADVDKEVKAVYEHLHSLFRS
ncbi:MAG: hypothetical protein ABSA79_07980 [Candidatus Bathyarchaeia archaeon]|jgi:hypothetical protein